MACSERPKPYAGAVSTRLIPCSIVVSGAPVASAQKVISFIRETSVRAAA
jgi:hypothetical protein